MPSVGSSELRKRGKRSTTASDAAAGPDSPASESASDSAKTSDWTSSLSPGTVQVLLLLWCTGGIYVFFLLWAILQQRITAEPFVAEDGTSMRFTGVSVLNLIQALSAAAASYLMMLLTGTNKPDGVPTRQYVKAAISNTLASPCGYSSLYFTSYLFLAVGKSCKLLPIMAFDYVMNNARFSKLQIASVTLITVGIVVFKVYNKSKVEATALSLATLAGCLLILANLAFDGFTSAVQTRILNAGRRRFAEQAAERGEEVDPHRPGNVVTSYHLMHNVNKWACVMLAGWLAVTYVVSGDQSELGTALRFLSTFPQVWSLLVAFGVLGAIGQLFIFYCIATFSTLVCTTVCITRKFFSILLSVYLFPDSTMPPMAWVGILLVFAGLGLSILEKARKQAAKTAALEKLAETKRRNAELDRADQDSASTGREKSKDD